MSRARSRPIAAVVVLIVIAAAAYTGLWFWQAKQLAARVDRWIADGQPAGITVTPGSVTRVGFPLRVGLRFSQPVIEHVDPGLRWTWRSDALVVAISPFHPAHPILTSEGESRIVFSRAPLPAAGMAKIDGTIGWAGAETALDYDGDHVSAVRSVLRDVTISDSEDKGRHLQIGTLTLRRGDAPPQAGRPEVSVLLRGERLRNSTLAPGAVDGAVSLFELTGTMTEPAPLPAWRDALAKWRDGGGTLDLSSVRLIWGPVRVTGSGTLSLDELLRPIGAFSIRIAGYNWMLDQLVAQHLMNSAVADLARSALQGLAEEKGNADGVPLPLRMQAGKSFLGPQEMGPVTPVL